MREAGCLAAHQPYGRSKSWDRGRNGPGRFDPRPETGYRRTAESRTMERTGTEIVLFTVAFVGLLLAGAGVLVSNAGVAVPGLLIIGLGVGGLLLRQERSR